MFEKNYKISFLLDYYGEILTEKQKDAIELYYNEDLSLAEIADHIGITRQGVRDSIKRGEETLIEMEEKLGLAARLEAQKEALAAINTAAGNIRYAKNSVNFYKIMDESVDLIIDTIKKLEI